jgi:hypothetical protein
LPTHVDPGASQFLPIEPPETAVDPKPPPITVVVNLEPSLAAKSR